MQNYTFVLDTNKQPLDPVHPAVARKMLSNGSRCGLPQISIYYHS